MASRHEGWTRTELLENQSQSRVNFKRLSPEQLLLALLALPTPLDHDDEDDEHRADPEADKGILAPLESRPKALQMTSRGQHRRACSQRWLCSGHRSNQLISLLLWEKLLLQLTESRAHKTSTMSSGL